MGCYITFKDVVFASFLHDSSLMVILQVSSLPAYKTVNSYWVFGADKNKLFHLGDAQCHHSLYGHLDTEQLPFSGCV